MTQTEVDSAISRHAPHETLYDQPLVDTGRKRVAGPFSVEAVPAPVVMAIDEVDDAERLPADHTVARSGETMRQSDWRDELLRTGIRGKAGQFMHFARLEPLPDYRYLHADGELLPQNDGHNSIPSSPAQTSRVWWFHLVPNTPRWSNAKWTRHFRMPRRLGQAQDHCLRGLPVRSRSGQGHR